MTLPGWGQKVLQLAIIPVPQMKDQKYDGITLQWDIWHRGKNLHKKLLTVRMIFNTNLNSSIGQFHKFINQFIKFRTLEDEKEVESFHSLKFFPGGCTFA